MLSGWNILIYSRQIHLSKQIFLSGTSMNLFCYCTTCNTQESLGPLDGLTWERLILAHRLPGSSSGTVYLMEKIAGCGIDYVIYTYSSWKHELYSSSAAFISMWKRQDLPLRWWNLLAKSFLLEQSSPANEIGFPCIFWNLGKVISLGFPQGFCSCVKFSFW